MENKFVLPPAISKALGQLAKRLKQKPDKNVTLTVNRDSFDQVIGHLSPQARDDLTAALNKAETEQRRKLARNPVIRYFDAFDDTAAAEIENGELLVLSGNKTMTTMDEAEFNGLLANADNFLRGKMFAAFQSANTTLAEIESDVSFQKVFEQALKRARLDAHAAVKGIDGAHLTLHRSLPYLSAISLK